MLPELPHGFMEMEYCLSTGDFNYQIVTKNPFNYDFTNILLI